MQQTPGFVDVAHPSHVCHLRKSLYSLKQAPRAWYHALNGALVNLDFVQSRLDNSLFLYHHGNTHLYLLFYVDDTVFTCYDTPLISTLIKQLGETFALKDLDHLPYFLGIEVVSCKEGLLYISDILHRHKMNPSVGVSLLLIERIHFHNSKFTQFIYLHCSQLCEMFLNNLIRC